MWRKGLFFQSSSWRHAEGWSDEPVMTIVSIYSGKASVERNEKGREKDVERALRSAAEGQILISIAWGLVLSFFDRAETMCCHVVVIVVFRGALFELDFLSIARIATSPSFVRRPTPISNSRPSNSRQHRRKIKTYLSLL